MSVLEGEKLSAEELEHEVSQFLGAMLRLSGLDLGLRWETTGETLHLRLQGRDAGLVLSGGARLLYAVNHLVNQAFFRRAPRGTTFVVDCNEYRSTRALELELMARKAAESVRVSGEPLELQAMPASERRVVHLALAEEPGVRTESEGTGWHRRVVIFPTD